MPRVQGVLVGEEPVTVFAAPVPDAPRRRIYVRWRTDGAGGREIISAKTEGVGIGVVPATAY